MTALTYIAPTRRRSMTKARAARIFLAANGICHLCGAQIRDGEQWDVSHDDPLALGGADDDTNAKPAHRKCHKARTKADKGAIAKRNRIATSGYAGMPKRRLGNPRLKQKVGGGVVHRDSGLPVLRQASIDTAATGE